MKEFKHINLINATYGDVKGIKYSMAILPWGATEPHNYHLPYLTDSILSHVIAIDASKLVYEKSGINIMVLPAVNCGSQNPGQHDLPFCIHYRYETQKSILSDIVAALQRQGINKLLILNGHGGNVFKNMIRDLYLNYPKFTIATTEWYEIADGSDCFEAKIDNHAAETETSVMMYYYPEKVNLESAGNGASNGFALESLNKGVAWIPRHWNKTSKDSGIGNPELATAKKGEKFAHRVVNKLADLLTEISSADIY